MSIWKVTTYKLNLAKEVYEQLQPYHQSILGKQVKGYVSPTYELSEIDPEDDWDDLALKCEWEARYVDPEVTRKYDKHFAPVKRWILGTSALYQLIDAASREKFVVKQSYKRSALDKVTQEVGKLISPSTQIAPGPFLKKWGQRLENYQVLGQKFEDAAEGFKFMRFAFDERKEEFSKIDQVKYFGEGQRLYYGYTLGKLCVLRGAEEYSERGLIFTKNHLSLLVEGLMRLANIYYYLATEYVAEEQAAEVVHHMLERTLHDSFRARGKNSDKVVQAYHKARMYTQMLIFENCHQGALAEAESEFSEKGLHDVLDLQGYLDLVHSAPVNRRLDVMQVYKWMMPPDFDSTYSFGDLYEWHMNPRLSGADLEASDEMKKNWRLIQEERKRNIIIAYHTKTREWPSAVNGVACQANNIQSWDLMKLFPYHAYGNDIVTQVKDKATVSASVDDEYAGRVTKEESSFLLWYMTSGAKVDTEVDAELLRTGNFPEDNFARVAYKGEAHKPGSRLFFMAPPRTRILLGELEGNISEVATYYPGSLQGKDSHHKSEMMQNLFDVYEAPPDVDTSILYEVFVITFDLSKFSPKSNYNVTRDYHDFWATVFGYPAISSMGDIGTKAEILHTQCGLKMRYKNKGADLEGFRGRMMTLFHADMLGAACRRARDEEVTTGKAVLAVFIDDGAVKIAARGADHEALANANRFLKIMQEVYEAAGQENHPNKTIVSKLGGELLAEQYLHGYRLKVPIKAAMRLYPDYENPACAITEEFDALFAASQGCVKDQALWVPTYYRYVSAILKAIARWDKGILHVLPPVTIAIKLITPKSYGGFGLQPWQGLVSTATLNLTAEGFGMLNRAARKFPTVRPHIYRIMAKPVLVREPLMQLRDPTRVRAFGVVLIENRLMMAIIREMEKPGNAAAKFMQGYRSEELRAHATAVAEALLSKDSISVPALNAAWQATPLAYVESIVGKFRRAKSIIQLIGTRVVSGIRRKNSEEVKLILLDV